MTPITREQAIALADKYGLFAMADEVKTVRFFYAFQNALTDFAEQVIADLEKMNSGLPAFKIMSLQAKLEEMARVQEFTSKTADAALAKLEQSEKDAARLRRIAWLIGSIYVHGNFKAETANESELELLLRENGTFWETLHSFDAALNKEPGA